MPRKHKDFRTINCNLDRSIYEQLESSAMKNDRTVTAELERILRMYFDKDKEDIVNVDNDK